MEQTTNRIQYAVFHRGMYKIRFSPKLPAYPTYSIFCTRIIEYSTIRECLHSKIACVVKNERRECSASASGKGGTSNRILKKLQWIQTRIAVIIASPFSNRRVEPNNGPHDGKQR